MQIFSAPTSKEFLYKNQNHKKTKNFPAELWIDGILEKKLIKKMGFEFSDLCANRLKFRIFKKNNC